LVGDLNPAIGHTGWIPCGQLTRLQAHVDSVEGLPSFPKDKLMGTGSQVSHINFTERGDATKSLTINE
jgi:hypothetical protein